AALEIGLRLATAGAAEAVAVTGQVLDRYDLSCSPPRYAWPVVTAGANAVLAAAQQAAAQQAGGQREQRLRDDSAALADKLRAVAEKLETFGNQQLAHQLTFAASDQRIAGLIAAFGDPASGETGAGGGAEDGWLAAWDRAADAWEAVSEPYPLAQALLHAAEAALADGDRDGAAGRLQRAAGLAAGLAASPLGEEIALLARRAGIRMTGPGGAPADSEAGDLGLTGRELEVLRLVAAGRSNREIAAELFISPKTASVHVSNILGKLGAATRGEAAAKAHTLRLFEPTAPAR
ncbi:MAG TPA: helix-turn-helix transcriptional regulator, partial [Streptosporangiaceae bacterium]|nr:helix-turn-helix transcriptional regulator [Streptosporangiaceae bacterium]